MSSTAQSESAVRAATPSAVAYGWRFSDRAVEWEQHGILIALRLAQHLPYTAGLSIGTLLERLCSPTLARIQALEVQLVPRLERSEQESLTFGECLSSLTRACDQIVEKGERLFLLATGAEEGEESVAATLQILKKPCAYITSFSEDSVGMGKQSGSAAAAAQRLLDSDARLRRAVQPLVYLRTLFQIESAGLPGEVQQTFSALNAEIHALEDRVTHEFAGKFGELRHMRQALADFAIQHEKQLRRVGDRNLAQSSAMQASFAASRQSLQDNASRQSGLAAVTQKLSSDVGAVVVAMQAHDMVSQRVAHVRYGLAKLYEEFNGIRSAPLSEARLRLPGFAAVARLQASQARSAREQLEEASDSLWQRVQKVVQHVQDLDEDGLTMRDYAHITSACTGTIQILLDAIDETRELVGAAAAAARACYEPLQPLEAAAKSLTGNIDHTGTQMHRIALNTLLIAVRHGDGTGLEILAKNTATTAEEISIICDETETQARELTQGLAQTLQAFSAVVEEGEAMAAEMEETGLARQMELHALRDVTLGALGEMGTAVERAREVAARMTPIDFAPLCRDILPQMETGIEELARLAMELCESLHAELDPQQNGLLQELASQYSMASERQTHAQVFLGESSTASECEAGGTSDLGDNVDLF